MRIPPSIAALAMLAACASTRPLPPAPPPLDPTVKVSVVEASPAPAAAIGRGSVVRVVAAYSLASVQPGKDRIAVVFKDRHGERLEASHYVLSRAQGRVTFEVPGRELLTFGVGNPAQARVVIDRWKAPQQREKLAESAPVTFTVDEKEAAKFLPPSVGKGQLLSDMQRDPRYRPGLPPELNHSGMVVWGLFKLCVNETGQVFAVSILKSADPLVDADWVAVLRTLQHRPYTINGKAVDYCYPMRLEVRSVADPVRWRR